MNLDGLKILDLSNEKYTILNWLAILMENRIIILRTLQQYELGTKYINKASAASVYALAKTLNCNVEDLLEMK